MSPKELCDASLVDLPLSNSENKLDQFFITRCDRPTVEFEKDQSCFQTNSLVAIDEGMVLDEVEQISSRLIENVGLLGQLLKGVFVTSIHLLAGLTEFLFSIITFRCSNSDRCAVGGQFDRAFRINLQQVENRTINDKRPAIAVFDEVLTHPESSYSVYTMVTHCSTAR
jgi:hypothetical protein